MTSLLPNPYLPGLVPLLFFSTNFLGHLLVVLMQVWFVAVLTFIKYSNTTNVDNATDVQVSSCTLNEVNNSRLLQSLTAAKPNSFPYKDRLMEKYSLFSKGGNTFLTEKRIVSIHFSISTKTLLEFEKVKSVVNCPLSEYASSRGIKDSDELERLRSKFGRNEFDIPQPTFISLYKQQLVQPITVFQVLFWC